FDLAIVEKTEELEIPYWCPTTPIPEGEKTVEPLRLGITHVHHFYTKRNLYILADLFAKSGAETLIVFQSIAATLCSKLVLYNLGRRGNGVLPGTLYLSSLQAESNVILRYNAKLSAFLAAFRKVSSDTLILVSTHNANVQMLASNALDYIFTDPPFGGNLMYSELNFLWEAWLRVFTNNKEEAIENKVQGKGLAEYQKIMERCFKEYYRVLKPGRWMTVVFHNSKNSVWNAIQEGLWRAGFVVADVRTLDKQQGTFNQATAAGAVKKDLVISAYKPNEGLEERFKLKAGTEEGVWDFVRTHLKQLASVSSKEGVLEAQQERMDYMLYDRMVAFHVQRGIMVPMSAAEFYAGLEERFPKRDGMYFLPDQAAEYDRKKMQSKGLKQLDLFVRDEDSAILWVKQQLSRKPQTFQELHPQFTKESIAWVKFEKHVELADLLKENFLCYDGTGPIPNQIVSWLKCSEKYRDKINEIEAKHGTASSGGLETDDPELISAAKDRWYVPNPNQAADLEKLREKALLREFQEYRESSQRKLKAFRLEAVKAGFKKAWQDKDYHTIVDVADKLPEEVVQEDPKILMWYNQAVTKVGRE
ncbi:MAG: DNA methyltransferase, partial [Bacillota bacterium]